jgi:YcaO-like protein with predicted kinase domain
VLHGLCEVIERDALALWDHLPPIEQQQRRVRLCSIHEPVICRLLAAFEAAGITPTVWDVSSDVGIAAFRAVIYDEAADADAHPFPAAFGAGCHPSRTVALARALTEAAQSRLTVIAGSRDDFGRIRYAETQNARALAYNREIAHAGDGPIGFDALPDWEGPSVLGTVQYVCAQLRAIGIQQVLYVPLSDARLPISVARVIVPGLEGPTESAYYYPGARVRRQLGMALP